MCTSLSSKECPLSFRCRLMLNLVLRSWFSCVEPCTCENVVLSPLYKYKSVHSGPSGLQHIQHCPVILKIIHTPWIITFFSRFFICKSYYSSLCIFCLLVATHKFTYDLAKFHLYNSRYGQKLCLAHVQNYLNKMIPNVFIFVL